VYNPEDNTYHEVDVQSDSKDEDTSAAAAADAAPAAKLAVEQKVRFRAGDSVIALFRPATVLNVHQDQSLDVRTTDGDVINSVLAYCVMTEAQAKAGAESFKEYIQKGRKQKPGNQLLSADDTPKELTLKARQKLDKQIAESIAGENIKRHKLFWPEEAQLVNYCKWTKIQRGDQELHVATCVVRSSGLIPGQITFCIIFRAPLTGSVNKESAL
jgi:hypothetical protein